MKLLLLRRALSLVGVLLMLTVAVYLIRAVIPADPVRAMLGPAASQEAVREARTTLGLDKPIPEQYVTFVGRALHGDLGRSLQTRRTVVEDISQFAPPTIELVAAAMVVALLLALFFALVGSRRGIMSGLVRVGMIGASSAPVFLVAILLLVVFFLHLGWLPASGQASYNADSPGPTGLLVVDFLVHGDVAGIRDAVQHLVIPATCLALAPAVAIGRVLRGAIVEVMQLPYVRTARAKGLAERRVLLRHALRNASGPALSMAGLQIGALLAGDVVIEQVMGWPGVGRYAANAVVYADFPAITGVVLVFGTVYVVVNAAVDVLQIVLDPRLRQLDRSNARRGTRGGASRSDSPAAGGPSAVPALWPEGGVNHGG